MTSAPAGTNRQEAFSDGVFAIAITLLVLEIAVPIAGMWANHHGMLRRCGLPGRSMRD